MKPTTEQPLKPSALADAPAPTGQWRLLTALVAVPLLLALWGLLCGAAAAASGDRGLVDLRVGHTVKQIVVPGTVPGENRTVDVHLWYPADPQKLAGRPKAVYTSVLHGIPVERKDVPLTLGWQPLSWSVEAEIARDGGAIDPRGPAFPVIVFSHGSTNDPIDYAHTLELIAAAGFVVAAPYHVNNTQDDARLDFINQQAKTRLFDCHDGLLARPTFGPGDCSKGNVPFNMADRVRDIRYILDALPAWFGNRVDASRAGVLGHSRGTVTALAAAGGSVNWTAPDPNDPKIPNCQSHDDAVAHAAPGEGLLCWPLSSDPRVKAIMGLAIGAAKITTGANAANVSVPTVLVPGQQDQAAPQAISEAAFKLIPTRQKAFVSIPNAVHRSFDSTYCAQAQAAGGSADTNGDGRVDPGEVAHWITYAPLDRHTLSGIVGATPSGTAMQYCSSAFFTTPVDIGPVVTAVTDPDGPGPQSGTVVPCLRFDQQTQRCTRYDVPTTGLNTDQVKLGVTALAATFFGTVLKRGGPWSAAQTAPR